MIQFFRMIFALLALLLGAIPASAKAQPAAPAAVQIARPALWKVAGPKATIYLFGTVHLLPADVLWFDGAVAKAFSQSDTLVTEILTPTPEANRALVMAKGMLPAGQSLRDLLAPDERQRFEAALTSDHLGVAAFDRLRPWLGAVTLAMLPMMQMGYDPANGVDVALGLRAKAAGVPQEALETPEYQLGLFAALPPPVQKAYLMEVVKKLPDEKAEFAAIIAAWKTGKADELARLMNEDEAADDPELRQILLIDRNKNWAQWIKARLARPARRHETIFIAVGAGHLAGEGSVIDQLRALGIASQRVQ